jgi:hypothetical protein
MAALLSLKSLNKINNSKKFSNLSIFSKRETEYSSYIKQLNNSNNISSIKRPNSSSKIIKKPKYSKIKKAKKPNIFYVNKSSEYSQKPSNRNEKIKFYIEDYFNEKNNSKINKRNAIDSLLNIEKYYSPNSSLIKPNNKRNAKNFNLDFRSLNKIYLTETSIKKPRMKKEIEIKYNNYKFDYSNDHKSNDYSKSPNADILYKFSKEKSTYDLSKKINTEFNDRIIKVKNSRINICNNRVGEYISKTRQKQL